MRLDNKIISGGGVLSLLLIGVPALLSGYIPGTSYWDKRVIKDRVAAMLIDPASAQFRDVRTPRAGLIGPATVCGEVNGKNRMGAYAGFTRFYWYPNFEELDLLDGGVTQADVDSEYQVCRYTGDCSTADEKKRALSDQAHREKMYSIACAG